MSSSYGGKIKVQLFGQSHSEGVGVVIDGLPPNEAIDLDKINAFLERRKGGKAYSTKRAESDTPTILSGLVDSKTCGAPLCAIFENKDIRSGDYAAQATIPRPSHADYNAHIKYKGAHDIRGGGHFSARLTLPLCFAGAVCMQLLERANIRVGAHIYSIGSITDAPYDPLDLIITEPNTFPTIDQSAGEAMQAAIAAAMADSDSIGGIVECGITGVPQGLGDPIFDGLENLIAAAIFGIPGVRGIEFGTGFAAAQMRGSQHNDQLYAENDTIKYKSNHAGGIVGGISTSMPIIFRAAFKPTPSIAKEQASVNMRTNENATLVIKGRHDPCIVPRAVPCVEAAAAIAIAQVAL